MFVNLERYYRFIEIWPNFDNVVAPTTDRIPTTFRLSSILVRLGLVQIAAEVQRHRGARGQPVLHQVPLTGRRKLDEA